MMTKDQKENKRKEVKENLPAWFDKDIDKINPTSEEQLELDKILKELV